MDNIIRFQSERCLDADASFLASLLLRDVNRTIRNIQTLVVVLLQYALTGISITNSWIRLIAPGDEGFGCDRKEK